MPVTPTYPGVYIEEIPSGVRTITGVATSITAFIGRAVRGPVNQATTITSFADFERTFGGLSVDRPMSYAVRDFYANGGSLAVIVRLFSPFFRDSTLATEAKTAAKSVSDAVEAAATAAGATLAKVTTAATKAAAAVAGTLGVSPAEIASSSSVAAATTTAAAATGATPATVATAAVAMAANYRAATILANGVSIPGIDAAVAVAIAAATSAKKSGATLATVQADVSAAIANYPNNPEKTLAANVQTAVTAAAAGATPVPADLAKAASDEVKTLVATAVSVATAKTNHLTLVAASSGAWANALKIRIEAIDKSVAADVATKLGVTPDDLFNLIVRDDGTGATERYLNVTVVPSARRLDKILNDSSNLIRSSGTLAATVPDPDPAPPSGGNIWLDNIPPTFSRVGPGATATDGLALSVTDFLGDPADKTGLEAVRPVDLFNLLCIPPDTRGGTIDNSVYQAAMNLCVDRRAMLIVDSPAIWSANPQSAASTASAGLSALGLGGQAARNAALYFPRVIQPDPLQGNILDTFVPCGMIAGIMARTDASRGVWKAPAGLDASLNNIQDLEIVLTDPENGVLNPLGINCLRSFPVNGRVVWGARTLRGADQLSDEYKYIPVRRLALFLEESLFRGTQWVVFEPNDEPLWSQIRLNIGAFMHNLFRLGAFQGNSPKQAYFVKVDSETTTQNDIDNGIVNIVVGFAPLKPAEFVIIQLQQMAGQIQV